jgi:hypothetical protein
MQFYFSFDVEAQGLFGEPFAVGWVVVNQDGHELEEGFLACPVHFHPEEDAWVIENVLPTLPEVPDLLNLQKEEWGYRVDYVNCINKYIFLLCFWNVWTKAKQKYPGIMMVTDCPFPVEANFLLRVQQTAKFRMDESPYPLVDVASVLLACGKDPTASYDRQLDELPAHNPVNDARQSVRIMLEAMRPVAECQRMLNPMRPD